MELKDRTSYDLMKDSRQDVEEQPYENYSFHINGQHFSTLQNEDKEKILNHENIENSTKRRKKRKKKRTEVNQEVLSSPENDQSPTDPETTAVNSVSDLQRVLKEQRRLPLTSLGTREELQKIEEEFCSQETEPNKIDIRQQAIQQAIHQTNNASHEKTRHYDYVLVYKPGSLSTTQERLRETYEKALEEEGFKIEKKYSTLHSFVILHCPFERLCIEAEHVILQMPLAGVSYNFF